ncbi:MAG: hypothetical protein OSJ43_03880 [Oscillospiraceae bacterium]|nr:hypothetical protein [Oscillospiraceae bacterium]
MAEKKEGDFVPTDILLDKNGDILVSDTADITPKYSVRQDVKIRLQWFFEEWRFAPEYGLPYFDEVFIKNPNLDRIAQIIREEAAKVTDVTEVRDVRVTYDKTTRSAAISFTIITDYATFTEEVKINV